MRNCIGYPLNSIIITNFIMHQSDNIILGKIVELLKLIIIIIYFFEKLKLIIIQNSLEKDIKGQTVSALINQSPLS